MKEKERETVKIYLNTCTEAVHMYEQGEGYSLLPWGGDTRMSKGYDDGGMDYALPPGYVVGESRGHRPYIYDPNGRSCEIGRDPTTQGPILIRSTGEAIALRQSRPQPRTP